MDTIKTAPGLHYNHHANAKAAMSKVVYENGTLLGAVSEVGPSLKLPEIVISGSSNNTLQRSRCDIDETTGTRPNTEDGAIESTALLAVETGKEEAQAETAADEEPCVPAEVDANAEPLLRQDAFEQFVLNRTTSDSNMLDSSVYSELQFAPSQAGSGAESNSGGPTAAGAPQNAAAATVAELLNSSACSRESRQTKRARRKHKSKSKCSTGSTVQRSNAAGVGGAVGVNVGVSVGGDGGGTAPLMGPAYPPQYTTIYLDNPHHHHHGVGAVNAMGQIASAAATPPFRGTQVAGPNVFLQHQYQYFQQRPLHLHHSRSLLDGPNAGQVPHGAADASHGNGATLAALSTPPAPLGGGATLPPFSLSFRKWFSRPSLPFVIGILALGGVACTLGGIVLGSTGLIEHSTQYLSAALLMIGIGVSLLVISGAIWRLSLPDESDECLCYRHMETCRNCNSPFCNNRLMAGGYFHPEFQHRPPPPSYLTSLNECAAMGLLFHPTTQLRMNTPPPLYRSTNSLSVFLNGTNGGNNVSFGGPPTTTAPNPIPALNGPANIVPDHNAFTMSAVMENLQAQTQPTTKEINYLELD